MWYMTYIIHNISYTIWWSIIDAYTYHPCMHTCWAIFLSSDIDFCYILCFLSGDNTCIRNKCRAGNSFRGTQQEFAMNLFYSAKVAVVCMVSICQFHTISCYGNLEFSEGRSIALTIEKIFKIFWYNFLMLVYQENKRH